MNVLQPIEALPVIGAIGWTLVHFLWQGALVALVLAGWLRATRERNANTRYLACIAAMAAMIGAPIVTMIVILAAGPTAPVASSVVVPESVGATLADRLAPALPALTLVWLVGVFLLQTRLVLNWSHAQHLKHFGTRAAPRQWDEAVHRLSIEMGVRGAVRILESSLAPVPMLIGWLWPVILIPTSAFTGLSPEQLRSIIAHELTHVRRHDYVVNLIQSVFETVLFYHPAVWWVSRRMRVEREYCCDDVAVRVCGDALCYARALSSLDTLRDDGLEPALASTGGSLVNRIYRIAGIPTAPGQRIGGWVAPVMIAASMVVTVSAMAISSASVEPTPADVADEAEFDPLDHVNIVGILREFRADEADMIAFLSETGVNNRALMVVLEEMGADERVFEVVERAARREVYVEEHMNPLRQRIAAALAGGKINMEEVREKLGHARHELRSRYKAEQEWNDDRDAPHARVVVALERERYDVQREIHRALEVGEITEVEAAAKLRVVEREVVVEFEPTVRVHADAAKVRLAEVRAELHAMMERDQITEAQAHERLQAAELELESWRARMDDRAKKRLPEREWREVDGRTNGAARRLVAARADLEQAVAAGTLTREQAQERLQGIKQELGHLREVMLEQGRHEGELREREAKGVLVERVKLREIREELHQAVEQGRLTEAQAADRMRAVEQKLAHATERGEWRLRKEDPDARPELELKKLHARVADEVAAGRLTKDEARVKLEAATREIHASQRLPKRRYKLTAEDRKVLRAKLQNARTEIEQAIAAGKVSEVEAVQRLERLSKLEQSLKKKSKDRPAEGAKRRTEERDKKLR